MDIYLHAHMCFDSLQGKIFYIFRNIHTKSEALPDPYSTSNVATFLYRKA